VIDGRYELRERLPDWGSGEVWKARDTQARGRLVGVALLHPVGDALRPVVDATLRRVAGLRHGAVLAVLRHGFRPEGPYVVQEHFDAPTLSAVLAQSWREDTPLPRLALERIAEKLLDALEAAHTSAPPIVHGRLRPECVLVQRIPQVDVRVADFAVAARKPGVAEDIAGVGAVLRAMFAAQAAPGEPPPPRGRDWRRADLPDEVWEVVERATAARPSERYADVESLRGALVAAWGAPVRGPARRPEFSESGFDPEATLADEPVGEQTEAMEVFPGAPERPATMAGPAKSFVEVGSVGLPGDAEAPRHAEEATTAVVAGRRSSAPRLFEGSDLRRPEEPPRASVEAPREAPATAQRPVEAPVEEPSLRRDILVALVTALVVVLLGAAALFVRK
jgi:hypothetical protein